MEIKEINTRQELYCEFQKYGIGAEIGVCRGHNAMWLNQITKPKKLYLCEIWREEIDLLVYGETIIRKLWKESLKMK